MALLYGGVHLFSALSLGAVKDFVKSPGTSQMAVFSVVVAVLVVALTLASLKWGMLPERH